MPSLALARKDLRDLLRERTILVALLLQLFVAAFSSFLVVGLTALYDPQQTPGRPSDVAYVGPGGFDATLAETDAIRLLRLSFEDAKQRFDRGRLAAIVEETYAAPGTTRTINLLLPDGELTTTLLVTQLKAALKAYERDLRTERAADIQATVVYFEAPPGGAGTYAFAYTILLPLLLIVPAFLSGAIAADAIGQEIQTRTLELLRSAPAGPRALFLGKTLTPVLLAPAQALLWILLLRANGFGVNNAPGLLLIVTALATLLVAGSATLALLVQKPGDAQAIYSLLVLLLFLATYLAPQPVLTTLARLAVGSFTGLEAAGLLATLAAAAVAYALALLGAPRLLRRIP